VKSIKRLSNNKLVNIWSTIVGGEGESGLELVEYSNHSGSFRVYSDGSVYYYKLRLAEILDGVHTVYDHTSTGGSFISMSTSRHVNRLKNKALRIVSYNGK
jgi:hypothetical protein